MGSPRMTGRVGRNRPRCWAARVQEEDSACRRRHLRDQYERLSRASTRVSPTPSSSSSQIGTVTETIQAVELARKPATSRHLHRSGETRTPSSQTSPLPPPDRSRPAPLPALTASPNTTNSSVSKRNSAPPPAHGTPAQVAIPFQVNARRESKSRPLFL